MADNSQGSRSIRRRHLRHLIPTADGTYRPATPGRVYRHARNPGSDKYLLVTEAGWRIISAAFSLGAFTASSYFVFWYEVMNK